jgi:hypothetical protein
MKLLGEEGVECDGQAQYRDRKQSAVPALEDVCIWIIEHQQSCNIQHWNL